MRGKLVTIAIAGMMLAVGAVAPAMAGQQKVTHIDTKVTIKVNADAGTISGKVKSDNNNCVAGRKVKLNQDGQDVFTAHADDNGNYGIKTSNGSPLPSGRFETHSPRLKLNKHKVCDPGDSKIVNVP
jgi:hypothetical protein